MVDDAWIRGEIECCDLHPSEHSRRMKSALLELLSAREVVRAARECVGEFYPMTDEDRPLWIALNKHDEATR